MERGRVFRFGLRNLVGAVAVAFGTALFLRRQAFRLPFDLLLLRLRSGRPFSGGLASPDLHLLVVGRLHGILPPARMGPCMKRSLLLLHLWSRCGLRPSLHLGVARGGEGGLRAHAWLTARAGDDVLVAGSSDGYAEAFVFPPADSPAPGDQGPG